MSVMIGLGHSKNGVASLAYVPVISIPLATPCHKYRDCRIKSGNDAKPSVPAMRFASELLVKN
jgi:hypothetical protein